ncbi:MAG: LamG domain-containing protein, partial [candidate division WS1 bacterium]|nr:LamG domain-containing protein [candidate division WS1 bacterium]
FSRWSPAYLPDLTPVPAQAPRYLPAKFGEGVLIEYSGQWAGVNQFPPGIADAQASPENFKGLGDVGLTPAQGTQGRPAMLVDAAEVGAGFTTQPVSVPLTNRATFSLYVKGEPETVLTLEALKEGLDKPAGSAQVTLTGDWQRAWVPFPLAEPPVPGHTVGEASPPLTFKVTIGQPGKLLVQALMLEIGAGYGGRGGVSTWMPAKTGRAGEIVALPPPNAAAATLALWANLQGNMGTRSLLAVGYGNGWYPELRLDLKNQKTLSVQLGSALPGEKQPRGGAVTLPEPLATDTWHHFAVTWEGPTLIVYLDGQPVITVPNAPEREKLGGLDVGGVSGWPSFRADAVLDEFAAWDRALTAEQITQLVNRDRPLSEGLDYRLTVADQEPVGVFARDPWEREWHLRVANRHAEALSGARITYGLDGVFDETVSLPEVPAGRAAEVAIPWQPYLIRPGNYTMKVAVQSGDQRREISRDVEVVPARMPLENVQVINWGGIDRHFYDAGVTAGGLAGGPTGPAFHEVEECVRNGMYVQYRLHMVGEATDDADRFLDAGGNLQQADQASPGPRADAEAKAEVFTARAERLPDLRYLIENSEHQWIWAPDFRPATIAQVKERFGLDLTRWQGPKITKNDHVAHPYGRLIHGVGNYPPPENGIVPLKDPFYAYSRWWQSGEAGNEVFLNDMIARKVRAQAPWVQCIWEPALRRPAVRVFKDQDILEEWYYYPSPLSGIWTGEALAAATRGTRQRYTGMPQFLFKPGMAAPYGGMPTPHMWRETVWHCMSRPIVAMTYWNLWSALVNKSDAYHPKGMQTQEDLDELLGAKPSWDQAKEKITATSESSSVFLWIPELKEEITRLHHEDLAPLGALLPRWENRPRQLAVYRSFAGQMFNNIRWPGGGPLNSLVGNLGLPFDVIYDQDFEDNPRLLETYKVVVCPENPVITEPAAQQLKAFLARGGKVLADDYWKVDLPGVQQFKWTGVEEDAAALAKREQELLTQGVKPDSPAFMEAMEQASSEFLASSGPTAQATAAILAVLAPEASTTSRHVYFNTLRAGEANYVVAVNDLRVPGRHYGHFGRVLEDGVAQTVEVRLDPALGRVAYALPQTAQLPLAEKEGRLTATLDLPPAGGQVLVLLPERIGKLNVTAGAARPAKGTRQRLSAELLGQSGKPVPGVIPLRVTITGPEGEACDYSRYAATV